jgi:hypothetical protein
MTAGLLQRVHRQVQSALQWPMPEARLRGTRRQGRRWDAGAPSRVAGVLSNQVVREVAAPGSRREAAF